MTRYLVADTHFGDPEVLVYTDRPFGSVGEMNDALLDGWNRIVDDGDEVVVVGDFAVPSEPTTVRRWLDRVAGEIIFVAGDHDAGARRTNAIDVREVYRFEADGYGFACVHDPADASTISDGWLVHGHHHDMRPDEYPFLDPDARRVNVGVELIGYEPIPVPELLDYVAEGARLQQRPD